MLHSASLGSAYMLYLNAILHSLKLRAEGRVFKGIVRYRAICIYIELQYSGGLHSFGLIVCQCHL